MNTTTKAVGRGGAVELTREQRRRVRELMVDEGETRAAAVARVLAFEPASAEEPS